MGLECYSRMREKPVLGYRRRQTDSNGREARRNNPTNGNGADEDFDSLKVIANRLHRVLTVNFSTTTDSGRISSELTLERIAVMCDIMLIGVGEIVG